MKVIDILAFQMNSMINQRELKITNLKRFNMTIKLKHMKVMFSCIMKEKVLPHMWENDIVNCNAASTFKYYAPNSKVFN